jgi:hypothetical protein
MFRLLPVCVFAGLLLVFTSCERHHPGEWPELQKEHLHPLHAETERPGSAVPTPAASATPTPANFFEKEKP